MPTRGRRVVVLAHCHLNANTKVKGLAEYGGVRTDVLEDVLASGAGIVQLPCPEATHLGMKRWGMTVEQYDTPAYRRHCRGLLSPVIDTLTALASDDCVIERVVGVEGSPSCGVSLTCAGYDGGELALLGELPHACDTAGTGVFMQEFKALLAEAGLDVMFTGEPERPTPTTTEGKGTS